MSAFLHALWNALLRLEREKDRALVAAIAVATAFAAVIAGALWSSLTPEMVGRSVFICRSTFNRSDGFNDLATVAAMILDRFRLDDQVAVVTGAGRGLGAAMALSSVSVLANALRLQRWRPSAPTR